MSELICTILVELMQRCSAANEAYRVTHQLQSANTLNSCICAWSNIENTFDV